MGRSPSSQWPRERRSISLIASIRFPGRDHAVLRIRVRELQVLQGGHAEGVRCTPEEMPVVRQEYTEEARVRTGVSLEGSRLVRDRLQIRQGEPAQSCRQGARAREEGSGGFEGSEDRSEACSAGSRGQGSGCETCRQQACGRKQTRI